MDLADYPTDDQIRQVMLRYHQIGCELSLDEAIKATVTLGDLLGVTPREAAARLIISPGNPDPFG